MFALNESASERIKILVFGQLVEGVLLLLLLIFFLSVSLPLSFSTFSLAFCATC